MHVDVTHMMLENMARQAERAQPMNARFPQSVYYRFLAMLAERLRPKVSVELGVCTGAGSYHLAVGWPAGRVIGVDVRNDYPASIMRVDAMCNNFEFWMLDSIVAAHKEMLLVDILFIDTIHVASVALAEWNAWKGILSNHAVVCIDDVALAGMEEFWPALPEPKMRLDYLHEGAGFGVKWL